MEKKYITWMAVLAVVIVGILAVSTWTAREDAGDSVPFSNDAPGTGAPDGSGTSADEEYVVTYTDDGFSPSSTSIELGETVTFRNESSRDMWVASAPHPQHTDHPEFDMKESEPNGGTYSFTFDKAGEWKFHNHLFPSHFGSVNVR